MASQPIGPLSAVLFRTMFFVRSIFYIYNISEIGCTIAFICLVVTGLTGPVLYDFMTVLTAGLHVHEVII